MKATIVTASGIEIDLLNPTPEMIRIEDIAHALANICRFGGHTSRHYSVAHHSVFVSEIVPREIALEGLMHDASEAFIGDMVKPLKDCGRLQSFREIEDVLMKVIAEKFGLNSQGLEALKPFDFYALECERLALMPRSTHNTGFGESKEVKAWLRRIFYIEDLDADDLFLERFKLLTSTPNRSNQAP